MTTDAPTRRAVVKAAAWSIPVIAVAVATPLAAASTAPVALPNRLRFTNATATVGKEPNTIYVNTAVQVIDGPAPVENVVLVIDASFQGKGKSVTRTWALIAGWGNGGRVELAFPGAPKGAPITVTFTAMGKGVTPIATTAEVVTPSWWS